MIKYNLMGRSFGSLLVIRHIRGKRTLGWLCQCKCGKFTFADSNALITGHKKSCGCERIALRIAHIITHGHTRGKMTRTYRAWVGMLQRCSIKNKKDFSNYAGRGINVCRRWHKFNNFLSDMGIVPEKMTLDRINNNKGYQPNNCRWATRKEQSNNMRTNRKIKWNNETLTISQWAKKMNIERYIINGRIYSGWSEVEAISTPKLPAGWSKKQWLNSRSA